MINHFCVYDDQFRLQESLCLQRALLYNILIGFGSRRCRTLSSTLNEKRRWKVFENGMLRISWPKCITRTSKFVKFTKYYWGDQINGTDLLKNVSGNEMIK
jgi:hypothetical protein